MTKVTLVRFGRMVPYPNSNTPVPFLRYEVQPTKLLEESPSCYLSRLLGLWLCFRVRLNRIRAWEGVGPKFSGK